MAAGVAVGVWVLVLSLWGAVAGGQNITARIGESLVLNCKGAPKKPPQQLEWKLNTGRTEAWKVLSPQGDSWDSVARVLPNGSLLLPAVGIQDEGTFRCRATSRSGKETKSNYRVRVYQIPGKPEIIAPASELMAGVPNKVGTCVSDGGYPAGTLSWHLDGKPLIPDGKGVSVKEETRRHPETGLFTVQSELTVTLARGGAPHPTFSCSFNPGLPRRRAQHTAPIQPSVWEPVPLEEIQLVVEPEGGAVAPGETVTLTCAAPAQPPPQIHWIKDGMPLPLPSSPVLLLPEVGPQDQGTYSCVATRPRHGPQESPAVRISIIETGEEGTTAGEGMDKVRQKQRQTDPKTHGRGKAPENQEEEEERSELNQSQELEEPPQAVMSKRLTHLAPCACVCIHGALTPAHLKPWRAGALPHASHTTSNVYSSWGDDAPVLEGEEKEEVGKTSQQYISTFFLLNL
ncbi:advanced glycosylation end product-specific receptor isoform X2 [Choloepus didactylus]|uniref:advanced glycosylation end product-specific receptor isoform X2 n=1 Tax=Choloepus didactylus TaxID=27675 RepID=UPI00189E8074|nr:advanced glycosylation end product-specific receptor isoform X2 [Choloepus didactylus]